MDIVTHTLMGAALCSRTGLAGGRRGAIDADGKPRLIDWTLGAAAFFGLFPDIASLGLHMAPHFLQTGTMGWRAIPSWSFMLYDLTHSLIVASLCILLVALFSRPLAGCMLAWPLHILTDMLTHGPGRFATPVFFPVSDYRFSGINWWQVPGLFSLSVLVCLIVLGLILRYRWRQLKRLGDRTSRVSPNVFHKH